MTKTEQIRVKKSIDPTPNLQSGGSPYVHFRGKSLAADLTPRLIEVSKEVVMSRCFLVSAGLPDLANLGTVRSERRQIKAQKAATFVSSQASTRCSALKPAKTVFENTRHRGEEAAPPTRGTPQKKHSPAARRAFAATRRTGRRCDFRWHATGDQRQRMEGGSF